MCCMTAVSLDRNVWNSCKNAKSPGKFSQWPPDRISGYFRKALRVVWWWGQPESKIWFRDQSVEEALTGSGRVRGNGAFGDVSSCTDRQTVRFNVFFLLSVCHHSFLLLLSGGRKPQRTVTLTKCSRPRQIPDHRVERLFEFLSLKLLFSLQSGSTGAKAPLIHFNYRIKRAGFLANLNLHAWVPFQSLCVNTFKCNHMHPASHRNVSLHKTPHRIRGTFLMKWDLFLIASI